MHELTARKGYTDIRFVDAMRPGDEWLGSICNENICSKPEEAGRTGNNTAETGNNRQ
jgi:hypothetical protein